MALGSFVGYERIPDMRVAHMWVDAFQEAFLPRWIVDRLSVHLKITLETIFYLYKFASFHKGRGRKIKSDQKVHSSIAFCDESYHLAKSNATATKAFARTCWEGCSDLYLFRSTRDSGMCNSDLEKSSKDHGEQVVIYSNPEMSFKTL